MAVDMFMKLDGIKGESQDSKHKEGDRRLSWSWGVSNRDRWHMGGGGGAGKVDVQDISIYASRSTRLRRRCSCCAPRASTSKALTVRKAGEKPLEYLKIVKLKDIIVTSVQTGGSAARIALTENLTQLREDQDRVQAAENGRQPGRPESSRLQPQGERKGLSGWGSVRGGA